MQPSHLYINDRSYLSQWTDIDLSLVVLKAAADDNVIINVDLGNDAESADHGGAAAIRTAPSTLFTKIEYIRAKARPYLMYDLALACRNAIVGSCWPSHQEGQPKDPGSRDTT